jgi:hypothetical protein
MHKISDTDKELLRDVDILDFDIFEFTKATCRDKSLVLLATSMINSHHLLVDQVG